MDGSRKEFLLQVGKLRRQRGGRKDGRNLRKP